MTNIVYFTRVPGEFEDLDDAISFANQLGIQTVVFQFVNVHRLDGHYRKTNIEIVLGFSDYQQYLWIMQKLEEEPISTEEFFKWST